MKKMLSILVVCALVLSAFSADANAAQKKKWTVMVFLNADNNLERAGIEDVNEMEMIGSSEDVNVICLLDRRSGYDSSNGDWTGTKMFYIEKDNDLRTITSPVIKDCGELNMGSIDELKKFAKYCMDNYPAEKYFLDIWNHGAGWKKRKTRGISFDDSQGHAHLSVDSIRGALAELKEYNGGKNIDVLGFDACLMGMIEVAYTIKDVADVMVAAEETEPGDGWEYHYFLKPMIENPDMDAAELGRVLIDAYEKRYGGKSSTTLSAVDLRKYDNLMESFTSMADILKDQVDKSTLISAANMSQSYAYRENKDLYDFCKNVINKISTKRCGGGSCPLPGETPEVKRCGGSCPLPKPSPETDCDSHKVDAKMACENVQRAIKDVVIANVATGYKTKNSHGIAVYIPTRSYQFASAYKKAFFAKETNWVDFLNHLLTTRFDDAVKEVVLGTNDMNDLRAKLAKEEDQIIRFDYNEASLALATLKQKIKISAMRDIASMKFNKVDYLIKFVKVNEKHAGLYNDIMKDIKAYMIKKASLLNELGQNNSEITKRINMIK